MDKRVAGGMDKDVGLDEWNKIPMMDPWGVDRREDGFLMHMARGMDGSV